MGGPGTICKCGLAKSYHGRLDSPPHEYEPRYDPVTWAEAVATRNRELAEAVRALDSRPWVLTEAVLRLIEGER